MLKSIILLKAYADGARPATANFFKKTVYDFIVSISTGVNLKLLHIYIYEDFIIFNTC